jgi:hypothetical protein
MMLGGKGQNRARGRRKEVADGSEIELLCSEIFLKAKMLHETFCMVQQDYYIFSYLCT